MKKSLPVSKFIRHLQHVCVWQWLHISYLFKDEKRNIEFEGEPLSVICDAVFGESIESLTAQMGCLSDMDALLIAIHIEEERAAKDEARRIMTTQIDPVINGLK